MTGDLNTLAGSGNRIDALRLCRTIVSKYFPSREIATRSVDPFQLAAQTGIQVTRRETQSFEGAFEWCASGHCEIVLSTERNPLRDRFTLAHELGHWIIHKELGGRDAVTKYRRQNRVAESREEKLANMFAAEILLPLGPLVRRIGKEPLSSRLIRMVTESFRVSRMAAMRRIADVAGTKIVFLNVVPNRFRKCESHAIVDQAIYAIPGMGLVFDREAAKLTRKVPFSMFARSRTLQVGFTGSCGRVVASFDVASRSQPIPNADLIAAGVEFR